MRARERVGGHHLGAQLATDEARRDGGRQHRRRCPAVWARREVCGYEFRARRALAAGERRRQRVHQAAVGARLGSGPDGRVAAATNAWHRFPDSSAAKFGGPTVVRRLCRTQRPRATLQWRGPRGSRILSSRRKPGRPGEGATMACWTHRESCAGRRRGVCNSARLTRNSPQFLCSQPQLDGTVRSCAGYVWSGLVWSGRVAFLVACAACSTPHPVAGGAEVDGQGAVPDASSLDGGITEVGATGTPGIDTADESDTLATPDDVVVAADGDPDTTLDATATESDGDAPDEPPAGECAVDGDCAAKATDKCSGKWFCDVAASPPVCVLNASSVVKCAPGESPCSPNLCDPATGVCGVKPKADGTLCDDGVACTKNDSCLAGQCAPGLSLCCKNDAACVPLAKGNLCVGQYLCDLLAGECIVNPTTKVICPSVDDTACAQNVCEPKSGKCGFQSAADGANCDDGSPCTQGDACTAGKCKSGTNICECKDDAACAAKPGADKCKGPLFCNQVTGKCELNASQAVVCSQKGAPPCQVSVCEPTTGLCKAKPTDDNVACDADGTACTAGDHCQGGACKAGTNKCACTDDAGCVAKDDNLCNGMFFCNKSTGLCEDNPATAIKCPAADDAQCGANVCEPKTGECAAVAQAVGSACDDGVVCTHGDACAKGKCVAGPDQCSCKSDAECAVAGGGDLCLGTFFCDKTSTAWSCKGNPATVVKCAGGADTYCQKNLCQPATGKCEVVFMHVDEPCDDGSPCTLGESCKAGVCVNPALDLTKPCFDDNPCTLDICDKAKGCENLPSTAACNDNNACTQGDTCQAGKCAGSAAVPCDDGNPCTTELCNATAGCVKFQNGDGCSDGNDCTVADACKAGKCVPGAPKDCNDKAPCTLDTCNPGNGKCVNDAQAAPALVCDDGIACTDATCDPATGCSFLLSASACDDGVACTKDACLAGLGCVHPPDAAACEDGAVCTIDACDLATKACSHGAVSDGSECADGDACTLGDACQAGKCAGGSKVPGCGADSVECKGKPNGTSCSDGDACTQGETCIGQKCRALVAGAKVWTLALTGTAALLDGPARLAGGAHPAGLAVDSGGGLLFVEESSHTLRRLGPDGVVRTLAGQRNVAGSSDGPGTAGHLSGPRGVAVDAAGTIYVADTGNHRIRKVTAAGLSTLAGSDKGSVNAVGAAAKFNEPSDVAVDPQGNVFVADTANNLIRRIAPDGTVSTFAGSPGKFNWPTGLAFGPGGVLWVADSYNSAIRTVQPDGTIATLAGGASGHADGIGKDAKFLAPWDITVDAAGIAYVVERDGHRVRRVLPDGTVTTLAGGAPTSTLGFVDATGATARFYQPYGVVIDPHGRLIVADRYNNRLRVVELRGHACDDGNACTQDTCDGAGASPKCGVDAKPWCDDGNACTTETCDTKTGACTGKAVADGTACSLGDPCALGAQCGGGACGPATAVTTFSGSVMGKLDAPVADALYKVPTAAVAALDGTLYVADLANHLIRKVAPDGTVTTLAGSPWGGAGSTDGVGTAARFNGPSGLALDAAGNLIVADRLNHRIRRVAPDGTVTTVVGSSAGMSDGPAALAKLNQPSSVAVESSGAIVVADRLNYRIRRIALDGSVSTVAGAAAPGHQDGPAAVAKFYDPAGVAVQRDGGLVVADAYTNNSLRRIAPDGTVTTLAGGTGKGWLDGIAPYGAKLNDPMSVAVDAAGNVFFAEYAGQRIRVLYPDGRTATLAGNGVAGLGEGTGAAAQFNSPAGITLLPGGDLLVLDSVNHRLRRLKAIVKACNDANACTDDFCAAKLGCKHPVRPDGAPCSDDFACTVLDACATGACKPGKLAAGCVCKPGASGGCNDGNACTIDSCAATAGCGATAVADFAPCDDGNACTAGDHCLGGTCGPAAIEWAVEPYAGSDAVANGSGAGLIDGNRIAISGTHGAAQFNSPQGGAFDSFGAFWVADTGNNVVRRVGTDGQVDTVAGPVQYVNSLGGSADGAASWAQFSAPADVAADASGNVWVADFANHRVRRIGPDGIVTTVAGSTKGFADGKGAAAKFSAPAGITVDLAGNAFVSDRDNFRIRKVAPDGQVTTLAGSILGHLDGLGSAALFKGPEGIAFGVDGSLIVADTSAHAIRRVTLAGSVTTLAGGNGSGYRDGLGAARAQFYSPRSVAVDKAGNIYVADSENARVRLVRPDGNVRTIAGSGIPGTAVGVGVIPSLYWPRSVNLDPQGRVLVVDTKNHRVRRLVYVGATCNDGNACTLDVCDPKVGCSHPPAADAEACAGGGPCQVGTCDAKLGRCTYAPAPNGKVCDGPGLCQQQCGGGGCMTGALVTTAAGTGAAGAGDGAALKTDAGEPRGLAFDAAGALWFTDGVGCRVRKLTPDGVVVTVAGSTCGYAEGNGAAAKFNAPSDIAFDGVGQAYVADTGNHRIRKVLPDGTVSTYAGSTAGFKDDVGTLAQFNGPAGLAVSAAGEVFVADENNHRIRRIGTDGKVTIYAGAPPAVAASSAAGFTDGPAATARLTNPKAIARDAAGRIWVADAGNNRIRRIDLDGSITTIAGAAAGLLNGRGRLGSRFSFPVGITLLADGSAVVADQGNHLVRRVWDDGRSQTLAGSTAGFLDGFGSEVQFNKPWGVAVDKLGTLFVADTNNRRVRKVSLQLKTCTELAGVSRFTAAASCKAIQTQAKWSGIKAGWVDPDGGPKDDAIKTKCDQTSDGGGWTRIDQAVPDAKVSLLRGKSGRMMLKCADDGLEFIQSPATGAAWSWTKKSKAPGEWKVYKPADGAAAQSVLCGSDAAVLDKIACGFGYACASGAAAPDNVVVPGVGADGGQCLGTTAVWTGKPFAICGGAAEYVQWKTYIRSDDL
ncbi:MAG: hypothetical protein EXR79_11830 [Myxococcales bacterium]|nr:hypothetical protein [Myxococcales bacterium]